jgi:Zn-dependent peptidase ImmA (M78 family)
LERIALLAENTVRRHGTRNPFDIAQGEGISVVACPDFKSLKGMYKIVLGKRFIFLNGNLRRREAKIVLAHELGHDALHREMGENSIVQDEFILDMTLKPEYEANLFAANLLYSDETVLSLAKKGMTAQEIAGECQGNTSLVELKLKTLEKLGKIKI